GDSDAACRQHAPARFHVPGRAHARALRLLGRYGTTWPGEPQQRRDPEDGEVVPQRTPGAAWLHTRLPTHTADAVRSPARTTASQAIRLSEVTWLPPDAEWPMHPGKDARKALAQVRALGWSFR